MALTLKAARVNAGLTQVDVARALHVTNVTVSNWERGEKSPTLYQACKLVEMYGITLNDLIIPEKQV